MISLWHQFGSVFRIAVRRLLAERGLALATALGLTVAVALIMSVPLYADGVYFRLLRGAVAPQGAAGDGTPLGFRFRYVGARDGPLQWQDVQQLDAYLAGPVGRTLALPQRSLTHHFKTSMFRLYLPDADPQATQGITWISFGTVSGFDRHASVKRGKAPGVGGSGNAIDVLVAEPVALEYGLQMGETLFARRGELQIPIRVAGTWEPTDPYAGFWSSPLEELVLVPEEVFAGRVAPLMGDEVYLGIWRVVVDGSRLHASDVASLLNRINVVQREASAALPRVVLDDSPADALRAYQRGVPELTFLLLAFSVPMMGLLLAFITLVGGLHVDRQHNQIAVLRSRGATQAQVVGVAALEGLVLGAATLLLACPLATGIAWLIGRARSFLSFTAPPDLRVSLTPETVAIGMAAVALALIAQLLPTLGAAEHTIVTYKQERARSLRPPWWQRMRLDALLLVPTAYSFYVLSRQGRLAAEGGAAVHDIFQDPVLFLTPALGLFALTLFIARILPLVMGGIGWVAARTRSVGLVIAARQLARAPGIYTVPLILLILTLSLSAFTASLAETLDRHLSKQVFYEAGADLRLCERGVSAGQASPGIAPDLRPAEVPAGATFAPTAAAPQWFFRPVESHLELPGVRSAARVGRYQAVVPLDLAPVSSTFIGVDRADFPRVAYWQRDFGSQSLGTLMNALAAAPEGVLVSQDFFAAHSLRIGDPVSIIVTAYDLTTKLDLRIVGVIDLFPTWYPGNGSLFVGNLDYYFQEAGGELPYEVWLSTQAESDHRRIVASVRGLTALMDPRVDRDQIVPDGLNITVTDWQSAALEIAAEQQRPQRQGLFGLLSVGFVASALLTVLGFLLYALFSFRRRFIELGVLRAVGLSLQQMASMLGWELASLILIGIGAGTGLGVWVSAWFIPYLQVGTEASSRFPPFAVVIAWLAIARIYVLFAALFLAALAGLVVRLAQMEVSQAVKLGEAV